MELSVFFRKMKKSRLFKIGGVIVCIILLLCIFAPYFVQHDPLEANFANRLESPDWFGNGLKGHPFGADALGRDVLTRILYGTGSSLKIALAVVLISTFIGVCYGLIAGYIGGAVDMVLMRFADVLMSVPQMLLAICIVAMLGASTANLILVLCITSWTGTARIVRSAVLSIKNSEYIKSAKVMGLSRIRIVFGEVLPNCITPIIICATQSFGSQILNETGLSFLGLGVPLPSPSLGGMISEGRSYITSSPFIVIIPGVVLMIVVLAVNFMGDGINDIFNPKNRD